MPALLAETSCLLVVSLHHNAPDYKRALEPTVTLVKGWQSIPRHPRNWRRSYQKWTRRYHGYGSAMKPFTDGDQRQSWTNCPAKHCVQLFEGKLWKCPALAYLPMQHAKYRLSADWQPYLRYEALGPDATLPEVSAFLGREDEPMCQMCPAQPPRFDKPNPLTKARVTAAL